jgi:large subunit ribosomal protein L4e
MKLNTVDTKNNAKGQVELPKQFSEQVRPDLIKRAVLTLQSNQRQSYGAHPEAGKRAQAKLSRRRRKYKGSYGHGISRVPRKILSHRGTRFYWVAAVAPGTVKGRRAHPPKASKIWEEKINKKENRKAIRSAMAATMSKELVEAHGHKIPDAYPFTVSKDIETIKKAKDLKTALIGWGFEKELERGAKKKIRAGKGKARARPYKKKKSVLIVVSDACDVLKAGKNIPGIDITTVKELNAEILAPGAQAGRATLWSDAAIEKLEKEKLFI